MSQLLEYIKMAFFNILSNKIRSLLTMLGIIIGISSVILIMSLGNGAKNMITGQLDSIGTGQVAIMSMEDPITQEDLEYLKEEMEEVDAYLFAFGFEGTISTPKGDFTGNAYGCQADTYLFEQYAVLTQGRYFNEDEYNDAKMVCYLSESDAIRLFGNTDVIGMPVDIMVDGRTLTYTIIGLTAYPENTSMITYSSENDPIFLNLPLTSLEAALGFDADLFYSQQGNVLLNENANAKEACDKIINILEARHDCQGENKFIIQSFSDVMSTISTVINVITLFISLVAAISLLVGGVGVMNIMLVSVTERTREIGIRKSLGAKTGSILLQFLSESAIITLLGGILGIVFGFLGAMVISWLIGALAPEYAFTPSISIGAVLLATLFSSVVGIFFGIYPARKAAKLSPIEALRRM